MSEAERSEATFLGSYLQHVFQTIIYFMKIQSQNIYFKNIPAPTLEIE